MSILNKTLHIFIAFTLVLLTLSIAAPVKVEAISISEAEQAFDQWIATYYRTSATPHRLYKYSNNTLVGGGTNTWLDFWVSAVSWETVMDAYEETGDEKYADIARDMYTGFLSWGNWRNNGYNDDVLWWAQGLTRFYGLTGDTYFLDQATDMFNHLWPSQWDENYLGGGMFWRRASATATNPEQQKNVCTNAHAAIVAARLAKAYKDIDPDLSAVYEDAAVKLYTWTYKNLYQGNGAIFDNIWTASDGRTNKWEFTYDVGLFGGASYELYTMYGDVVLVADDESKPAETLLESAHKSFQWIMDNMTVDGQIILNEGNDSDGCSFRLVAMRHMAIMARNGFPQYIPFLQAMGNVAWDTRDEFGINWADMSYVNPVSARTYPSGTTDGSRGRVRADTVANSVSAMFLAGQDGSFGVQTNSGVYQVNNWTKTGTINTLTFFDPNPAYYVEGFSGRSYIYEWANNSRITSGVRVDEAGAYTFAFYYYDNMAADATRTMYITAPGASEAEIYDIVFPMENSETWKTAIVNVELDIGINKVAVNYSTTSNAGALLYLDKLAVSKGGDAILSDVTISSDAEDILTSIYPFGVRQVAGGGDLIIGLKDPALEILVNGVHADDYTGANLYILNDVYNDADVFIRYNKNAFELMEDLNIMLTQGYSDGKFSNYGSYNSTVSFYENAWRQMADGKEKNAVGQLENIIDHMQKQSGKQIDPAFAAEVIELVMQIITVYTA